MKKKVARMRSECALIKGKCGQFLEADMTTWPLDKGRFAWANRHADKVLAASKCIEHFVLQLRKTAVEQSAKADWTQADAKASLKTINEFATTMPGLLREASTMVARVVLVNAILSSDHAANEKTWPDICARVLTYITGTLDLNMDAIEPSLLVKITPSTKIAKSSAKVERAASSGSVLSESTAADADAATAAATAVAKTATAVKKPRVSRK